MKKLNFLLMLAFVVIGLLFAAAARSQEKPDFRKVMGTWNIEVHADGQIYYLTLVITEGQGQLAGTISESGGAFSNVAIDEIFYDGASFRFNFASPTPPDGITRTVKADFTVGDGTMGGTIAVPDLGYTADAKATRAGGQ